MENTWQYIDVVDPSSLHAARVQLHHAVQLPAMLARSYSPTHPEDEFGSLLWSHEAGGVVSQTFNTQWQANLDFKSMKLGLLKAGMAVQSLELEGSSLHSAVERLRDILSAQGMNGSLLSTDLPYEIPQYKLDYLFKPDGLENERTHFAHLFANCSLLLDQLSSQYAGVSDQRCWPHHFDLAAVMVLNERPANETQFTIGWGFSPGDEQHPQPYFYVNCWPYPEVKDLPDLPYGHWNTEGWVGTVLGYKDFAGNPHQQTIAKDYFQSSTTGLSRLLQA